MRRDDLEMNVSPITHDKSGKPQVFVRFTDGERVAEGRLPGPTILSQKGFSENEINALIAYMKNEKATILTMAKKIDVMSAFFNDGNDLTI